MKKLIENKYLFVRCLLFLLFLFLLYLQYQHVFLYYDDFGLFSLTYGWNVGKNRTELNLFDVFSYTYNSWGAVTGRIIPVFMCAFFAFLGGLKPLRVFVPICIVSIYAMMEYNINKHQKSERKKVILTFFLLSSYGLLSIFVCNYGLYWFGAAFVYIFPFCLFFAYVLCYEHNKNWIAIILAFLCCICGEQTIAMTIVYTIGRCIYDKVKYLRISRTKWCIIGASVLGSILALSSPAYYARMDSVANAAYYNENFFHRIFVSANYIMDNFFNKLGIGFICFFGVIMIFASFRLVVYKRNIALLLFGLHCLFVCLNLYSFFASVPIYDMNNKLCEFWFIYFVVSALELFYYFVKAEQIDNAMLVLSAFASLALLLFVPEIPVRTFIPFIFLFFYLGAVMLMSVNISRKNVFGIVVLFLVYFCYGKDNFMTIYQGYVANAAALEYNDRQLTYASWDLELGEPITSVKLYRLPDATYAGQQLYGGGLDYMQFWMNAYYMLPNDITYDYYDFRTNNNRQSYCVLDE